MIEGGREGGRKKKRGSEGKRKEEMGGGRYDIVRQK